MKQRIVVLGAVMVCSLIAGTGMTAAGPNIAAPVVSVRENRGLYTVEARFVVAAPPTAVLAVLTDYERIPDFMPDMRTSIVRTREAGRAIVEQEAVARALMFTKRVHLVLAIDEQLDAIQFRDTCGRSFERYEGEWRITPLDEVAAVSYTLRARPAFKVPEFLIRRLLQRDATEMLEHIAREVIARLAR